MLRRPAFTAVAMLTLGVAIGANVTIYSWVQALLLQPIPAVAAPERLAVLSSTTRTRSDLSVSWPNFVDLRAKRPASVDDMIAFTVVAVNVRTGNEPHRAWGMLVSGNYFAALGVRPACPCSRSARSPSTSSCRCSSSGWRPHCSAGSACWRCCWR